jgi:NAD(P)-dependent dehydrogenase (short-subunit alcohol dehydrogenase family)
MSQNILITGTSSGFGSGAAKALAQRGHKVFATMRQVDGKNRKVADELRAFASKHGVTLEPVDMDVTSTTSVNDAVSHILARAGHIDAVINNAAIMPVGISEGYTVEQFQQLVDTNLTGVLRVNQAVLPGMRSRRSGLLVHITSIGGRMAMPFMGLYNATKFALEAMAESLRYEVSQLGVESIIIEPGPFATNLYAAAPQPQRREIVASYGALQEMVAGMGQAFEGMFASSPDAVDPALVVNKLVELVDLPAGTRPVRSVVGMDFGVLGINQALEPFRRAALESMGMGQLDTVVVGKR